MIKRFQNKGFESRLLSQGPVLNGFWNLVGLVLCGLSIAYISWRWNYTRNPDLYWFSISLVIAEGLTYISCILSVINFWRPTFHADFDHSLLNKETAVFIPTYNEPFDVVETTVFGAVQIRGVKKVYLLDDGKRPEMAFLAKKYGIEYITRDNNLHAKAGNLNNALAQTKEEFILVLDADFIPQPQILERSLGFFVDEGVAVVQFPQEFYNIDSTQHVRDDKTNKVWHEQRLFHEVIMPYRNGINTSFWCGSPAVLRRKALEEIGGVLTSSITEDFETSMRFQKFGYRCLFSSEIVAFGLSPHHISGFRIQRSRWGSGTIRNLFSSRSPFFAGHLNIFQKLSYFSGHMYYFNSITRLYFLLLPIQIYFFGNGTLERLNSAVPIKTTFTTYCFFNFLLFFGWYAFVTAKAKGHYSFIKAEVINIFNVFTLPFDLLKGALPFKLKFKVTPKTDDVDTIFNQSWFLLIWQEIVLVVTLYILFLSLSSFLELLKLDGPISNSTQFIGGGILFMVYQSSLTAYTILHLNHHRFTTGIYRFAAIFPIKLSDNNGGELMAYTFNMTPHGIGIAVPKIFDPPKGDVKNFALMTPLGEIRGTLSARWVKNVDREDRWYRITGCKVLTYENEEAYLKMMYFCYIFMVTKYPSPTQPIYHPLISIAPDGQFHMMKSVEQQQDEIFRQAS